MFSALGVPAHALISLLMPIGGAAAAIVIATVLIRILLLPLGYAAHRAEQRRTTLMRRIAGLKERYANSPKRLHTELEKLYRAEGGSLARGCLPMLVQMPVFVSLYQAVIATDIGGHTLWGVPLAAGLLSQSGAQFLVFAGALVLLAAIGYASSRLPKVPPTGLACLIPYAPMLAVAFLPLAATLYIVTSSSWTVLQTLAFRHWFV